MTTRSLDSVLDPTSLQLADSCAVVLSSIAGNRITGSQMSFAKLRGSMGSLWNTFGAFTAFITNNPSPLTSDLFSAMVESPYSFDDDGKPNGRPTQLQRWHDVAKHPVMAARLFHIIVEAFQEVYLGWPPGEVKQQDPNCLFGQVLAFFYKYEVTGRGDLHAHQNITQPDLQPGKMLEHVQTRSEDLQRVLETLMCRTVAAIPEDMVLDRNADPKPAAYRPKLDGSVSTEVLTAHICNCQEEVQDHHHTCTCAKDGHAANNVGCRVRNPQPKLAQTSIIEETGAVVMRCNRENIVPRLSSLMLANSMNNATYLSMEAGGYLRDVTIWATAAAAGITKAAPPLQLSAFEAAAEKAEYSARYSTKSDNFNLATPSIVAATSMLSKANSAAQARVEAAESAGRTDREYLLEAALNILRQLTNIAHGCITYAAQMCAMHRLQLGDSGMSHESVIHDHRAFTQALHAHNGTDSGGLATVEVQVQLVDGGRRLATVSCVDDYKHRPEELQQLSPVLMSMLYFKRGRRVLHDSDSGSDIGAGLCGVPPAV